MDWSEVLDVTAWPVASREPAGSGENTWLLDPSGLTRLFKPNRIQANGQEQGEDWAELLAHRIAAALELPSAVVAIGVRRTTGQADRFGALSSNVITDDSRKRGYEMQSGGVLLSGAPGYHVRRSDGSGRPVQDHVGHTVDAVFRCLAEASPPAGSPTDACGTFAGYLTLDALIGNQDRHEENWGVIVAPDGALSLAPSFDHGASLGFGMTDERRASVLGRANGLALYAAGGTGRKFEGRKTPLLTLARTALSTAGPHATREWLGRLGDLTPETLEATVHAVPRMSDLARTFCSQLLLTNRRRLLDVRD